MNQMSFNLFTQIAADMQEPLSYLPYGIIAGILLVFGRYVLVFLLEKFGKVGDRLSLPDWLLFCYGGYFTVFARLVFFSRKSGSRSGCDWRLFATWGEQIVSQAYFVENILLFIPLGILLPLTAKRFQKVRCCAAAGMLLSLLVEFLQLLAQRGYCQVDDIVTNTLGTVVGSWGMVLVMVNCRMNCDRMQ